MEIADFNRIWSAVYGHPAWSVKHGHGSFLTLEFGQPELQIREPRVAAPGASECVRERLSRRDVNVTGRWHLWIYCCNWSITLNGKEAAYSDSPDDDIKSAVQRLDGQKLLSVSWGETPGAWVFTFDLGGELKTWPYDDDPTYEQWFLFVRDSGNVLSVRADGLCSYDSEHVPMGDETWTPINARPPRPRRRRPSSTS
ncbi:hypothetical protein [Paraburkholderia dinghuensis]|uniref:Uncharacterized protein n=1 Tax=Paraburkholderia dinghuensis TaxID=2305225 RepID=A0A3N6MS40_9BURK|nr:hypothetical protein [Paraburkholderia dinghuensis]RQH06598.1 hypothetical protein D1Y85_12055 [Paraburkholderia dinghuensis]